MSTTETHTEMKTKKKRLTLRNLFISISYSFFLWKDKYDIFRENILIYFYFVTCWFWTYLFTAFLVSILLDLFQQFPPLATHHHTLCAGHILHVWHQLSTEHRVTVSVGICKWYIIFRQLNSESCTCFSSVFHICSCDSRRRFVGSAVRFVLQVPLGLGQGWLYNIILGHV